MAAASTPDPAPGTWTNVRPALNVRVFQWNVLADHCADKSEHGFPYVDDEALDTSLRRPMQLDLIIESKADIIALQEVDNPDDFEEALAEHDYQTLYNRRHDSPLGVLVAFKKSWELVQKNMITFSNGGQVATIVKLKDPQSGRTVVFAATHLKAKADNASALRRGLQSEELLSYVKSASDDWNDRSILYAERTIEMKGNVIVAGDFNDSPGSCACRTWSDFEGFTSAYPSDVNTTFKLRPREGATGLKDKQVRTEDYIFHNGTTERVRELPKDIAIPYFPSKTHPSDHVALCAEVVFVR